MDYIGSRNDPSSLNIDQSCSSSGLLESLFSPVNSSYGNLPTTYTDVDINSFVTEQHFPFEMVSASPYMHTRASCNNPFKNYQEDISKILESSDPLYAAEGELLEMSSLSRSSYQVDDIFQWLDPSPQQRINDHSITLNDDLSRLIGFPADSLQSSITNTFQSDGKEKTLVTPMSENDLFDCLKGEVGDFAVPELNGGHSTVSNGMSEISNLDIGSMAVPRKGLFSELGLEQILNDIDGSSTFEDQLSTNKRRKTESYFESRNPAKSEHHREGFIKSQVGLWIDDSYSINGRSGILSQPLKKPEEPAKPTKKRARPGESTRARPKDRQQIQDRFVELRKIIPNAAKLSIDSLLDRTIKHMQFLQSMAKYADKLKQVDEPKLIGQENGVVLKDNASGHGGGATWAFEVGGQSMVCPIIVEDLSPPGQMLIEMLCEERGLFLEIADTVRGFGLNILKGVMEVRGNKIWSHFIVEANKQVTRMDIFWSLIQFLQQPASNWDDSVNQTKNAISEKTPLFNNYQQPPAQPLSLVDILR